MNVQVSILCAMRDRCMAQRLCMEMNDETACTLRVVCDGEQAIEAAQQLVPDILIVDAVLAGVDGPGVVDRLREVLGARMPRIIAGSTDHFADAEFIRRGADALVRVPWDERELCAAIHEQARQLCCICFERCDPVCRSAMALLDEMGMRSTLKGYHYLSWAAALAYEREGRLCAIEKWIYAPVAERFGTTAQSVERLIRHAVERTMDTDNAGVYRFFGNTIDPMRGKPTNAQCISALVQRLRVQHSE